MAPFLGWINAISAILMGGIYPIKKKTASNQELIPLYRIVRKVHPLIGSLMVVIGGYHGYLMLGGNLRLHSGTLVWLVLILMGVVAVIGQTVAPLRKGWRSVHRVLGLGMLLLLAAHVIKPYWIIL